MLRSFRIYNETDKKKRYAAWTVHYQYREVNIKPSSTNQNVALVIVHQLVCILKVVKVFLGLGLAYSVNTFLLYYIDVFISKQNGPRYPSTRVTLDG